MSSVPTRMEDLRNELLADLSANVAMILADHGIDAEIGNQAGAAVADHLADNWGGQVISFPKDHFYRLAKRDLEILREFNGTNYFDLARKYDMTARGIRKLLKRADSRRRDELQPQLFDS